MDRTGTFLPCSGKGSADITLVRCGLLVLLAFIFSLPGAWGCPSLLCSCPSARQISCAKRRLDQVPRFTVRNQQKAYEVLDMGRNDIQHIGANSFLYLRVKSVRLNKNPIVSISPRAFRGLEETLETLDLSSCGIPVLHWAVFDGLKQLRILNMGENQFFAIPRGVFQGLVSLKSLILSSNQITAVKRGVFRGLGSLVKLTLSGNRIVMLQSESFVDLRNLKILNLNSNQLSHISSFVFKGLDKLQKLFLENNKIAVLPDAVFVLLPELKTLSLAKNYLTTSRDGMFVGLNTLEEIFLNENRIAKITSGSFSDMKRLKLILLNDNKLETLGDRCVLEGLGSLRDLWLQDNPIKCDCRLHWLEAHIKTGLKVGGQCASPPRINGLNIIRMNFTSCNTFQCP